jgi:hypothetical protein
MPQRLTLLIAETFLSLLKTLSKTGFPQLPDTDKVRAPP